MLILHCRRFPFSAHTSFARVQFFAKRIFKLNFDPEFVFLFGSVVRRFCIKPGSGPVRRAKNNIPPTRKHLLLTSFYEDYHRFKWVRNYRQVSDLNLKNYFIFFLFCEFANLYLTATSSIRAILRFFDRSNILLQKRPTHVV